MKWVAPSDAVEAPSPGYPTDDPVTVTDVGAVRNRVPEETWEGWDDDEIVHFDTGPGYGPDEVETHTFLADSHLHVVEADATVEELLAKYRTRDDPSVPDSYRGFELTSVPTDRPDRPTSVYTTAEADYDIGSVLAVKDGVLISAPVRATEDEDLDVVLPRVKGLIDANAAGTTRMDSDERFATIFDAITATVWGRYKRIVYDSELVEGATMEALGYGLGIDGDAYEIDVGLLLSKDVESERETVVEAVPEELSAVEQWRDVSISVESNLVVVRGTNPITGPP